MTEDDLLESLKRARQALSLASWGVARALTPSEPSGSSEEESSEEATLAGALQRFRQARYDWSKARGHWQHRASLMASSNGQEAHPGEGQGPFDTLGLLLERCAEEISQANLEKLAPSEAL